MARLPLLGGMLCLDFVNTIDPRHRPPELEYLEDYDALLDWAVHAGALTAPAARHLAALASQHPTAARRVYARAISLREALYQILAPATRANHPEAPLATLNAEFRHSMTTAILEPAPPGGYRLDWAPTDRLDQLLWPVVRSAADLLTSPSLGRVAECDGQGCGWLFVDTSKAGRRRWCSMAICGNRAKSQRHAQRTAGRP
ncbi:MAG TPA: ABATE domain-containing protein [Actinomycetes bacterium]|jgi:predicted RNA-binding Zn ribbon-like protein|nr:ABATE domain-containing protein [Actinomycetes bacterium]